MTESSDIQDAIITSVTQLGGFKKLATTPMEVWQASDLPALAVFLVEETMNDPMNGVPYGEPHFWHDINIGVQAAVISSDAEDQRRRIMNVLGSLDQYILTDLRTQKIIENFARIRRNFKYERVAEIPIVHLSELISIRIWSDWAPSIPDDYLKAGVSLAWPLGGDLSSMAGIEVKAVWTIDQTYTGPPTRHTTP